MSNYDVRPYCKAILNLAIRENNFSEWQDILNDLAMSVCPVNLDNIAKRQQLIDIIMLKFPLAINLLNILLQNNKLDLLPRMAIEFKKSVLAYQNIIEAKVISVLELDALQKEQLKKALERRYQAQMLLQYETDCTLIGGVVVYIGDQAIDGSIKTALHCLKQSLE